MTLIHFVSHKLTKQTNIMELDFFKNYITYTTHVHCTLRTFTLLLRLPVRKDIIFKTLNSDCLPFTWAQPVRENGRQNSEVINFIPGSCLQFVQTFLFTEKRRKEPESAITNFHFLTFTCSVAPGNFPPERREKVVFRLLSDRIFQKRLVNGKH